MSERFILWNLPSRTDRLNTHRMLSAIRADAPITARVVSTMRGFDDLRSTLARRHQEPPVDRFIDEAYMAAFEQQRKNSGGPKLTDEQMLALRRGGFGLDVEADLYEVWRQSIAMFHANARVPDAVRLLVGGLYGQSVELLRAVATLLASDEPFRRRREIPVERHIDVKQRVVRQWVTANGVVLQGELDAVERMIGRDIDHQLSRECEWRDE